MLNPLKRILFNSYTKYFEKVRIKKGKYRMAQMLNAVFGYAIYKIDGVKLELNPISLIDRKLISKRGHDPLVQEMLTVGLSQGGIFIDIGANIGYFSLIAAKMPNVKVLAFEPSPRELFRLYRNICLNKLTNITVFPYGLAESNQTLPLYLSGDFNPGKNSVLDVEPLANSPPINCRFFALDDCLPPSFLKEIRVVKIDVEGFEVSVCKGMANSMELMNEAIFIVEISPNFLLKDGCQVNDIYDFFAVHGYQPKLGMTKKGQYDEVFSKTSI